MIVCTTVLETDPISGKTVEIVDRAWRFETGEAVVLPGESPRDLSFSYDPELTLYVSRWD